MYATPHQGLGRSATGVLVDDGDRRTLSQLCQDTLFRIQNREACGQDIDPATHETIPQPITTTYTPPPEPTIAPPSQPTGDTVTTTAPTEPAAPDPSTQEGEVETVVTGGGGGTGQGWGIIPGWGSSPSVDVVTTGGEAVPLEQRGYGLLEVAIAAGLAWILSRAYQG